MFTRSTQWNYYNDPTLIGFQVKIIQANIKKNILPKIYRFKIENDKNNKTYF
jgi:hypothetical protein